MRTAVPILAFAASLAAQQSGIEGIVLNQATGQPLAGVHLRLYAAMILEGASQAYGAVTTADGHFSIDSMPPANYTVVLERTGFLQTPGDGFMRNTELALSPGQRVTGYSLSMSPLIPVSGRVVNQAGDPVPGASVEATSKPLDASGPPRASELPNSGPFNPITADDRGQFRLFATPGAYYLASWLPRLPFGPDHVPGGPGPTNMLTNGATVTYYPDASDTSSATPIDVKPGPEIAGLTIRLHDNAPRVTLTLNGVVTGVPPRAQATVFYRYSPQPGQPASGGSAPPVGPGGRFALPNRSPGYFRIFAQVSSGDTQLQSDIAEVHLEPSGAPAVTLALSPGGVVSGALEIAGVDSAALPAKLAVHLNPTGPDTFLTFPLQLLGPVGSDGAFRIAPVQPGRYTVRVDGKPEDAYIKAIALNGAPVAEGTLDFSGGVRGPAVKITLSLNGAQVSGEVRNADASPLLTPNNVFVSLAPQPGQTAPVRIGTPVVDGHYVFKGVPPGKYRIYATDIMRLGPGRIDAAQQELAAAAETVEVKEGDRIAKDLKAVLPEAPHANPQR